MNLPVWERGDAPVFAPLDGDVDADVCVIGLGGSGLSCITALLDYGKHVAGIDSLRLAGGAAGRNGGFLLAGLPEFYHRAVAMHGRERSREIYRCTIGEIERIAAETPEAVNLCGSLRIAADADELVDCDAELAALAADRFSCERYRGVEGQGLVIHGDGVFDPLRRCRILADRVVAAGALLFEQTRAREIVPGRVTTSNGVVHCRSVVVAVDGGLESLLPELRPVVRTARLQMLSTEPVTERRFTRPVYRRWGYDYWQQLDDGRIALGGARDLDMEAEWTTDHEPTETIQRELDRILHDDLGVKANVERRWAASVGYSASGLPVASEVRPGVFAIGGYSGTGNVLGALLGRGVAEKIATRSSRVLQIVGSDRPG